MPSELPRIHPRTPYLDTPRPSSAEAQAANALATLNSAASLARAKDFLGAREICAAVVLEAQPLLATHKELLLAAVHAMLLAHSFKLLARVVAAITGRRIQMVLLPERTGQIASPDIQADRQRAVCFLDPRWLEQLSEDDIFLRHLCDSLIVSGQSDAKLVGPAPAALHPEAA